MNNIEHSASEKVALELNDLDKQIDELENSPNVDPYIEDNQETPEAPVTTDNATETVTPDNNQSVDDQLNEIDDQDKAAEQEKPKAEETATPPEIVAPELGQGEKDKGNEPLLTEEYVKNLNLAPDKASKLNKFLGKPISEALKSFAHAQALIGRKKEELFSLPSNEQKPVIPEINTQVTQKAQTPDEIATAKDEIIHSELVKEFPDLPKDPQERKAWLSTLNYEDRELADAYLEKKRTISRDIDQVWKETEYLRQNHSKVIDKQIGDEISAINSYFVEKLGEDPKKFGYDLSLDKEGNNALINELLTDTNNPDNFDPNVVGKYNGVTLINKGALTKKFFEVALPNIIKTLKTASRQEGFEARSNKQAAPGMILQPGKGTVKGDITTDKIKEITSVDELDRMLDEEESK